MKVSNTPWMPQEEIEWLDKFLNKEMIVFEYGSGGSTLYVARKAKEIVSVEYQLQWYLSVKVALIKNRLRNCKLILARPTRVNSLGRDYASSDPVLKGFSFQKFVTAIDEHPRESFDLVIVDGRARNTCILHALPKVKKGGFIFLDDSGRQEYNLGKSLLNKYHKTELSRATVWQVD